MYEAASGLDVSLSTITIPQTIFATKSQLINPNPNLNTNIINNISIKFKIKMMLSNNLFLRVVW